MTVTINAVSGTGVVTTSDGSGIVKLQSNSVTTNALAWVSFTGSSGSIRSSYNVTSVTRNGTGDYTITFTNALTDANYSALMSGGNGNTVSVAPVFDIGQAPTTSTFRALAYLRSTGAATDLTYTNVAIFGN